MHVSTVAAFWYWLGGGVILAALEVVAPGAFLLWIGFAGIATGAIAFLMPGLGLGQQGLIFAGLVVVNLLLGRVAYGSRDEADSLPMLNRRERMYLGHVYPLAGPLVDGRGWVRIGNTVWSVESSDAGLDLEDGASVRILGARGTVLLVEPNNQRKAS